MASTSSFTKKRELECEETDSNKRSYRLNTLETYFAPKDVAEEVLRIERALTNKLKALKFESPVAYKYAPLEYAFDPHSIFVKKYCTTTKKVLYLGVNPGPFGMTQIGIPFGDILTVKNWLKIEGIVEQPQIVCNTRPITGCKTVKVEESGRRLRGLFKRICGIPEELFKSSFFYNYCPLTFMSSNGTNLTQDKLKKSPDVDQLFRYCNEALRDLIRVLKVDTIVAIGREPQRRALEVIQFYKLNIDKIKVVYMIHPSPMAMKDDQEWFEAAMKFLESNNLMKYYT